jgi:hypothetical protein
VLTPYVGGQRVIIFADSTVVDLTPGVDAFQQCGYQGINVPGNPNAPGARPLGVYDGAPVCKNTIPGSNLENNGDFNNFRTFQKARIHRWRGIVGVNYRYEIMYLAAQFATDLTDPSAENTDLGVSGDKQWTMSLEAGVFF